MYSKKKKLISALALGAGALGLITVFATSTTFDPDTQPIGYVAQQVASSYLVASGTEKLYAADYNAQDWSGNLHSYNLSADGVASATDNWAGGAAAQITAQHFDTGRKIVTFGDSAGVPFRWVSGISATQKGSLDSGTVATAASSPVLDYIRGDFSKQTNQATPGPYRSRTSKLGDIIHSTPVYWNDKAATPTKTVFVGANDGMLHAINADTGEERFAYIPSMLMPKLGQLSNPAYTHKYYVDGRLAVSNFRSGSQTILAGTLGGGGKALFALDVTNAAASDEADAAAKILWEISNTGIKSKTTGVHSPASTAYANLGYTYAAPTLLTLPGAAKALVVANGYNSKDGKASLFIINAETGALIKEIVAESSGSAASPNGLSTPTVVDTNNDGTMDTAFAGDIDGNLWKFSLVAPAYTVTKLHTAEAPAQSITTAPSYMKHPLGGYMVTFVTGRMLFQDDGKPTDNATHYAYGIWDGAPTSNTAFLTQTLSPTSYTSVSPAIGVRTATSNTPDWEKHKGWKTTLPVGGERLVGDGAFINEGIFQFTTTNPTVSTTATPPGANWWMQLNALTGGGNNTVQFDLNNDGSRNDSDKVTVATVATAPAGKQLRAGAPSQVILLSLNGDYMYQQIFDNNSGAPALPPLPPLPPPTSGSTSVHIGGPGVSGGHFDVDIYDSKGSLSHTHEYDDKYDVTGVNMLNASFIDKKTKVRLLNLSTYISGSTKFKVLAQNQYLSPAVNIHINGTPSYKFDVDAGYIPIKNFMTAASVDLATVPTYTLGTVNSLAVNMPVDAFAQKDWWGGALGLPKDIRVGLHPTQTKCVKDSAAPMYQPISPPATLTATGNGTPNANGLRHNGALVIQIIKDTTPQDAIEMSVKDQPQYGWRLKSVNLSTYLLAEYSIFWHHDFYADGKTKDNNCYGDPAWTKLADQDKLAGEAGTAASGSTDPKIGAFGSKPPGTAAGTYPSAPVVTAVKNPDGTTTTTTVTVTTVVNSDGSQDITTTTSTVTTNGGGGGGGGGTVITTGTVTQSPGTGPGSTLGRINWRELQQ